MNVNQNIILFLVLGIKLELRTRKTYKVIFNNFELKLECIE